MGILTISMSQQQQQQQDQQGQQQRQQNSEGRYIGNPLFEASASVDSISTTQARRQAFVYGSSANSAFYGLSSLRPRSHDISYHSGFLENYNQSSSSGNEDHTRWDMINWT